MAKFNPVTPELIEELQQVLGEKNVKTSEDYLEKYQTDEEGNPHFFSKPEVVVFPESTEQVAEVVKLANQYLVPLTPRSAGSNVAAAAIPVYHGIVVELEKMNKILTLDPDNLYATCETGVITGQLQEEARKHGLLYAGDPSSSESCQIGGNVANNAGGNKAVKYGTTRHQIYSLKVVTPTGDIVTLGARLQKCSTGLCLEQLLAGSEGTLGIITEVTVRLRPLPPYNFNMVCVFKTDEEAFALPNKILKAGIDPTSIEFMDNAALKLTCDFLGETMLSLQSKHSTKMNWIRKWKNSATLPKQTALSTNLKQINVFGNYGNSLLKLHAIKTACSRRKTSSYLSTRFTTLRNRFQNYGKNTISSALLLPTLATAIFTSYR